MARRNQRKGDHLATSDYSGCTTYASRLVRDYWGNLGEYREILKRNLQEIATPLEDPYPVKIYNGPQYEVLDQCAFETQPLYVGKTFVPFPVTSTSYSLGLFPSIPEMRIGCTFVVQPDPTPSADFVVLTDDLGNPLTTEDGTVLVIA